MHKNRLRIQGSSRFVGLGLSPLEIDGHVDLDCHPLIVQGCRRKPILAHCVHHSLIYRRIDGFQNMDIAGSPILIDPKTDDHVFGF